MARPAALPPSGSPRPLLADGAGRHRAPPGGGPERCPPSPGTGTTWRTGPRTAPPSPRRDPGLSRCRVAGGDRRSTDRFPVAGRARAGPPWGGQGAPAGCPGSPSRCRPPLSVLGSSSRLQPAGSRLSPPGARAFPSQFSGSSLPVPLYLQPPRPNFLGTGTPQRSSPAAPTPCVPRLGRGALGGRHLRTPACSLLHGLHKVWGAERAAAVGGGQRSPSVGAEGVKWPRKGPRVLGALGTANRPVCAGGGGCSCVAPSLALPATGCGCR